MPTAQSTTLTRLYTAEGIFGQPTALLDGLDGETATRLPDGAERSVADLVAHCAFWLGLYLDGIETGDFTALDTWTDDCPSTEPGGWPALRDRFRALVDRAVALAADEAALAATVAIHGKEIPVATLLGDLAGHNAYHLGQVVLTRLLVGAWPIASEGGGGR